MSNHIDTIQKIDSYLQGELQPEEVEAFEKQLSTDPVLRADLNSTQRVIQGIDGYAFKQKLTGFHDEYVKTKRRKSIQLYYLSGMAASLAFILIAYLYWSPASSNRYYSYFEPYASPVNVRSGNESNASQAAFEYYERGEYDQAVMEFQKLNSESLTDEIKFYQAISQLAQHHPKEASALFVNLSDEQYTQQVNWYLSLCYLLTNEHKKAKALLEKIKPEDYHYEQAMEILTTL